MEDELAQLRARVEQLERRADHVLGLADRIDCQVSSNANLVDSVIMRLLLYLAGDAYRDRMLRWLDQLAQQERTSIEGEGTSDRDLQRLLYWRDVLQKREPWPDFPPDGWMSPRAE